MVWKGGGQVKREITWSSNSHYVCRFLEPSIFPASALGYQKIVHMHEISVTVAAQRPSSLRGLKLRLFTITLPCSIWGQFYFLNTISRCCQP
jgi:hypothetical protein